MATIGTLFPTSPHAASSSSTTAQSKSSSSATTGSNSLANQNTFLTLLVAQLQYQDPTQPMDGTTFVTQLAQFSDLQANMGTKQDLDALSQQFLGTVPSDSSSSGTSTSASASGTSSTSSATGS